MPCFCREEALANKSKESNQQMLTKLEEIHHAYKKAKLKVQELAQEREGLERDKAELAEKFAEKCR